MALSIVSVHLKAQIMRISTSPTSVGFQVPGYSEVLQLIQSHIVTLLQLYLLRRYQLMRYFTTEDGKRYRYADILPVNINMNDGNITTTSVGKVWTLKIGVPNALNIGLVFNQFNLSSNAKMYVFDEERTVLDSGIMKSHFSYSIQVGISPIKGNSLVVYIIEPNNFGNFESTISIQKLEVGFQEIDDIGDINGGVLFRGASIDCDPLILCQSGKINSARAVARFFTNGYQEETGTLINNENNNGRAYFLTAFHVIDVGGGMFGFPNGAIDETDGEAALQMLYFTFNFGGLVAMEA